MDTKIELYYAVRERFPEITAKADEAHLSYWGEPDPESAYMWFESLAKALNKEMQQGVPFKKHQALFSFMSQVLAGCSKEVLACIDVGLVENLFWQVAPPQAEPYWQAMPASLKELYVGFHHRTPL